MNRRNVMRDMMVGAAAGFTGFLAEKKEAVAQTFTDATKGLPPLKITGVKAICTQPDGIRLVVVKVETSEPGLYGLGCSTFTQRPLPVVSAINDYLDPFCRGKDPANIEDMWQTAYVSGYWRNGPVLNNAMSGVDQALWDIKGKRANMPVYQLLGGKSRFAVPIYGHASGNTIEQLSTQVKRYMDQGYRHVRIQLGGYGSPQLTNSQNTFKNNGFGNPNDGLNDSGPYCRMVPQMFEGVRKACGEEIELIHDIHERIHPIDAINLIKAVEPYHPFFIEDPFAPEDIGYFKILRQQSSCPVAMGELFNSPHEWLGLISDRLIDYIRIHISQIGGITPAVKVARLAEWFNVRTAWHGPGDVSPVGHAANAHIDLAVWNFGIQEENIFGQRAMEVFPGTPVCKAGYLYINEAPGLGVTIDETLAAKYPFPENRPGNWNPVRKSDGTSIRQ
jgi:mannonate dehydratase